MVYFATVSYAQEKTYNFVGSAQDLTYTGTITINVGLGDKFEGSDFTDYFANGSTPIVSRAKIEVRDRATRALLSAFEIDPATSSESFARFNFGGQVLSISSAAKSQGTRQIFFAAWFPAQSAAIQNGLPPDSFNVAPTSLLFYYYDENSGELIDRSCNETLLIRVGNPNGHEAWDAQIIELEDNLLIANQTLQSVRTTCEQERNSLNNTILAQQFTINDQSLQIQSISNSLTSAVNEVAALREKNQALVNQIQALKNELNVAKTALQLSINTVSNLNTSFGIIDNFVNAFEIKGKAEYSRSFFISGNTTGDKLAEIFSAIDEMDKGSRKQIYKNIYKIDRSK